VDAGGGTLVTWYRFYALFVAVHALEVAIVGSAAVIVKSVRPSYDIRDVLAIVAVGMIAGAIYILSMNRLARYERKQQKDV
jgi:hypothetical protein